MPMRKCLVAVIPILFVTLPVNAGVCSDIASVYDASLNGFSAWKGRYNRVLLEYASRHHLPNAYECTIELDGATRDYACKWRANDENAMHRAYNSLVRGVMKCNLKGIKPRQRVRPSRDNETRSFVHTNKEATYIKYGHNNVQITVGKRSTYSKRRRTYEHLVTFRFENWQ